MKNAIKKGTYIGAFIMMFLGTLCVESDPIQGLSMSIMGGVYVIFFAIVNKGRWGGVL